MSPFRFTLLILVVTAPFPVASETMTFEEATAMLGGSCGADIDDNCRGISLDPRRLKECFRRNTISSKCQEDYPRAFSAIEQLVSARARLAKLCNWELNHLCSEVRQDPVKGLQCLLQSS